MPMLWLHKRLLILYIPIFLHMGNAKHLPAAFMVHIMGHTE